jgi:hypothetical protein
VRRPLGPVLHCDVWVALQSPHFPGVLAAVGGGGGTGRLKDHHRDVSARTRGGPRFLRGTAASLAAVTAARRSVVAIPETTSATARRRRPSSRALPAPLLLPPPGIVALATAGRWILLLGPDPCGGRWVRVVGDRARRLAVALLLAGRHI